MLRFTAKGKIQVWNGTVLVSSHVQEREAYERIAGLAPGKYTVTFPVIEVVSSGAFQSVYNTSSDLGRAEARGMAVQVVRLLSDTTPPAVPSGFSASAATATSVTLTLTANVESDFSNYVLERSSDNIGWGYLKSFTGTSTTDTVDVSNSVYYYRAFSIDTRGNRSAYTTVKSAGPYTVNLAWNGIIPNITFMRGNAQNFDLSPYIIGASPAITVETGTLPAGVTLNSSLQRLQYDGSSATSAPIVATGISLRLGTSAEADWNTRIAGSGVVWYHDFRSADEVNAFRWSGAYGNDPNDISRPNTVRWITTDYVTGGGCLEIYRPAGTTDGAVWWRPFSPIQAKAGSVLGNGRTSADPGAGITPRAWNPTNGSNTTQTHSVGTYGHPNYQDSNFDGYGFYVQMRVKTSASRFLASQPIGGKRIYLSRCEQSLTGQEIVWESKQNPSPYNYFSLYRSGGTGLEGDASDGSQPGNENNTPGPVCSFTGDTTNCWQMEPDTWETYLFHIVPGLNLTNDGVVQVWAAHEGETSYTKIWDMSTMLTPYQETYEFGFNALICSGYMNGQNMTADFYHRFDQIIFSTQTIPCPQV